MENYGVREEIWGIMGYYGETMAWFGFLTGCSSLPMARFNSCRVAMDCGCFVLDAWSLAIDC